MPRLSGDDPADQLGKSLSQPDATPDAEARHTTFDKLANRVSSNVALVKKDIYPALCAGASPEGVDRKTASGAIHEIEECIWAVTRTVHPSQ